MNRTALATTLLLGLCIGCASVAPGRKKAPLAEPEIRISQVSSVSEAARHITGGIPVQYRVAIVNVAPVPITIKRIEVQSVGYGAYTLTPASSPFNVPIEPRGTRALEFWASASVADPTILGANGPVTLRVTVVYDTAAGTAQTIVVQQVHAGGASS